MPLLKNGFLEKIETWYVGLSCQYTHFMSFSSKSEHDTVADQATLIKGVSEQVLNKRDSCGFDRFPSYTSEETTT